MINNNSNPNPQRVFNAIADIISKKENLKISAKVKEKCESLKKQSA